MSNIIEMNNIGVDTLLGSLALLRINVLSSDYITSFVPFVATLAIKKRYDIVDIDTICIDFQNEYGFVVPRIPMVAVLNACAKKDIIRRQNDGMYHVIHRKAHELCFSEESKEKSLLYHKVVEDFCMFAKMEFNVDLTNEDGEEILLSFINENSSKTLILPAIDKVRPDNLSKKHFLMIAKYIKKIEKDNYDIFKIVQDISTAHIISSSLINELKNENTDILTGMYHSLVLYLDTPVILKILGLNTFEMQESYLMLIKQLKERNNVLKIFQHTFDELYDILSDCERWIENPLYKAQYASPALKTFIEKKFTAKEVGLFIEHLEDKLHEVGIEIDYTDYYAPSYNYLQIDDTIIRNEIIEFYKRNSPGFVYETKEQTIERDVKSISAIFKLRRKKTYTSYKSAKYLFITTNTSLAYISKKSTKIENPSYRYGIYPCITDVVLGTDIWISSPIEKVSTFSRKKLLADCSAAIQPTDQLISKLSDSIEKLYREQRLSYDDYYLLKSRAFKENYIVNKTLNDENVFSDRITEEILEDIKSEIQAPLQETIKIKDDKIAEQNHIIDKLTNLKNQNDMEKKLLEESRHKKDSDAANYAEALLNKIHILVLGIMLPAVIWSISVVVDIFTLFMNIHPTLKIILTISALLLTALTSIIEIFVLRKGCKCRKKIINKIKKRKLASIYVQEFNVN